MMAKHISDFSKLPQEIIFDLINEQNGTALDNTMVELGLPTVTTTAGALYNTDMTVTSLPGSGYTGQVILGYNRLDVQGFLFGETLTLGIGDAENFADLIPEINLKLRTNITADDYIDGSIVTQAGPWEGLPNETKQITIQMNPDSPVFIGSLTLSLTADDIPLSSVITKPVMEGLNYPEPPPVEPAP
jgi:hypothetical protein